MKGLISVESWKTKRRELTTTIPKEHKKPLGQVHTFGFL